MKANRKVMLGAALVVAVVALAGVGYAAFSGTFTAITINDGNGVTPGYIKADQGEYTAIFTTATAEIEMDTYTSSAGKTYVLQNGATPMVTGYHGQELGTKVINLTHKNINPTTYSLKVSMSGVSGGWEQWKYYVSIDGTTFVDVATLADTPLEVTGSAESVTVHVAIGGADFGTKTGAPEDWASLGSLTTTAVLDTASNISFAFTFEATI